MAEIRIIISDKLDKILIKQSKEFGVQKNDYIKNLILTDLKNKGVNIKDEN